MMKLFSHPLALGLSLSLLFLLPFLLSRGAMYGFDLHFHLMRMKGLAHIFEHPINFTTFYNSGQGINFFYPYLTYLPYYLLYKCLGNIWLAWMFYLYILTLVTFLIAYYAMKECTQSSVAPYLFALLYTFSGYRIHNILIRFAIGELIAWTFIPLVFCAFYKIAKINQKTGGGVTIGMTLVIYSHLLSALMTSALLGLMTLITFVKWPNKRRSLRTICWSIIITLGLTAAFWVPMLEQALTVRLSSVNLTLLSSTAIPWQNLLLDNLTHRLYDGHPIGLVSLICLFLITFRYISLTCLEKLFLWLSWLMFIATSNLVNLDSLAFLHLELIQFPWRLNTYIILFSSFVFANHFGKMKSKWQYLMTLSILAFHIYTVSQLIFRLQNQPVSLPWAELSARQDYEALTHAVYVKDYSNETDQNFTANLTEEDPRWKVIQHEVYLNEQLIPSKESYTDKVATFIFKNSSDQVQVAYLPVYWYKGQVVMVNHQLVRSKVSPWASTEIQVEPGQHLVQVTYQYTWLAQLSFVISGLTAIVGLIFKIFRGVKIFS